MLEINSPVSPVSIRALCCPSVACHLYIKDSAEAFPGAGWAPPCAWGVLALPRLWAGAAWAFDAEREEKRTGGCSVQKLARRT